MWLIICPICNQIKTGWPFGHPVFDSSLLLRNYFFKNSTSMNQNNISMVCDRTVVKKNNTSANQGGVLIKKNSSSMFCERTAA